MKMLKPTQISALSTVLVMLAAIGAASAKDLWIHPRGATFDPDLHYRDSAGNLYFKAENDIDNALGYIEVKPGDEVMRAPLGPELQAFADAHGGSLRPVVLWDSDGDGVVDQSVRGRVEDGEAVFRSARLSEVNLRVTYWQLGLRFIASPDGDQEFDGRYVASVGSDEAHIAYRRAEALVDVASGVEVPGGLVILKHREGSAFDFAEFTDYPERYSEDFDLLTRAEDDDDWTVQPAKHEGAELRGDLRTHFEREDMFIVRTTDPEIGLDVVWGDVPLEEYFEDYLAVAPDSDGCYSTLDSGLMHEDGTPVEEIPNRMFFCPQDSVAMFDAPDGYEIGLSALREDRRLEYTEASTSIRDNIRLYVSEIFKRNPSSRETGSVTGNIRAGYRDAGGDLVDAFHHGVTGRTVTNLHDGTSYYKASPFTAIPRSLGALVLLRPLTAFGELANGVDGGIQLAASTVSAVHNTVIDPVIQVTAGNVASTHTASTGSDYVGAVPVAVMKTMPFSARSIDAVNPLNVVQHDRAFAPPEHTRTDTQLNIDRALTAFNIWLINKIIRHNEHGDRNNRSGDGDGGDGGGDGTPGGTNGGGSNGGGGGGGDHGGGFKRHKHHYKHVKHQPKSKPFFKPRHHFKKAKPKPHFKPKHHFKKVTPKAQMKPKHAARPFKKVVSRVFHKCKAWFN